MNLTSQIIRNHTSDKDIHPGKIVEVGIDRIFTGDIDIVLAIKLLKQMNITKLHSEIVTIVMDHFVPNSDLTAAANSKMVKEFVKEYGIESFFDVGRGGNEHAVLIEYGLLRPGDLIIGADSHTPTYGPTGGFAAGVGSSDLLAAMVKGKLWIKVPQAFKVICYGRPQQWVGGKDLALYLLRMIGADGGIYKAIEFEGEAFDYIPVEDRFALCNQIVECGCKNAIMAVDERMKAYLARFIPEYGNIYATGSKADYERVIEIDVSKIRPQVALPHSPANAVAVEDLEDRVKVDQVVIGCCANGRLEDLRTAAKIMAGKKVHPDVRLIIIPISYRVMKDAVSEGIISVFLEADGAVTCPTCGPCFGAHTGVLGPTEKAISTTNRNFIGRMGHPSSEVYLANPAVAAATAIKGYISLPT